MANALPRITHTTAIKVNQWLPDWNDVTFDGELHRRRPLPYFFIFSLPASALLSLSEVPRRSTENRSLKNPDLGIQRRHNPKRSSEIRKYVQYGYPWSGINEKRLTSGNIKGLQKPGWLPSAIVVNIMSASDERRGRSVVLADLIQVHDQDKSSVRLSFPENWIANNDWAPTDLAPIEIIDGQHRLLAFEDESVDMDLPVVAFYGLDVSWQAYLFWTINIRPKRINPSLAFDLYPLLRTEDWLDQGEGLSIYRETRAQELTESLWAHPNSPWFQRINMLGDSGHGGVTQNAWVRSLTATFIKSWEGSGVRIGGLFGAGVGSRGAPLAWSRVQQAAFLVTAWNAIAHEVGSSNAHWAIALRGSSRNRPGKGRGQDAAFSGPFTLLNTDQGVRAYLNIINDLCFVRAQEYRLDQWRFEPAFGLSEDHEIDDESINEAIKSLYGETIMGFIDEIASRLAEFDWRTSAAESLTEEQRIAKLGFRGSGGYKELRRQLLRHLTDIGGRVGRASNEVLFELGY